MRQSITRNLAIKSQLKMISMSENVRAHKPEIKQQLKQIGSFAFIFIMIVVLLGCIGGAALWVKNKINNLEKEKLELTVANKDLVAENSRILEVNKANVFIIDQMTRDKSRADRIVTELKQQRQKDALTLNNMRESIRRIIKNDPSKDGTVSPVLTQTIQSIIDTRYPSTPTVTPTFTPTRSALKKKGVK